MKVVILSNWLDTNGQNARYVRAAERWGDDPEVLKVLAIGKYDPAGVAARFAEAASKVEGPLVIREAHRAVYDVLQFPGDIKWERGNDRMVRALAAEADLIHLNNSPVTYQRLKLTDKPALLHHHGSLFRKDPQYMLGIARRHGMLQAVSTVDLMEPAPELLHWLPTAYDGDMLKAVRKENKRKADGKLRVVSCPTNPVYKSTEALEAAVKALQDEGLPVELVIAADLPWAEALAIKATADVVFDQVMFGYGCNGVEAWGMGLPVIAGGQPWTLAKMREMWGDLPFYEATEQTIVSAIRAMLDKDTRKEYAAKGTAHFARYHAERPALERLAELYRMALLQKHKASDKLEQAVTFVNPRKRSIYHPREMRKLVWEQGSLTTDDLDVVERLRGFERRHPSSGIREVSA